MNTLKQELEHLIQTEGPLSVARYMSLCLSHPKYGFYMTHDPLGLDGDFITAPEISQIFGELIGLWLLNVWDQMGRPAPFHLIELGPGRGTLLKDVLRAAQLMPDFVKSAHIHLVDTSPILKAKQQANLDMHSHIYWHENLNTVPEGPSLVIANEFFDALPVHQFSRFHNAWHERLIGLDEERNLQFGLAAQPHPSLKIEAQEESVLESPDIMYDIVDQLVARFIQHPSAALIIDYGSLFSGFGDTLQAVKKHQYADPFEEPGNADLTVHVDFAKLAHYLQRSGLPVSGPVTQGDFLKSLGIETRLQKLQQYQTPDKASNLQAAVQRLIGSGAEEMGQLFKVIAFSSPSLKPLPGF